MRVNVYYKDQNRMDHSFEIAKEKQDSTERAIAALAVEPSLCPKYIVLQTKAGMRAIDTESIQHIVLLRDGDIVED